MNIYKQRTGLERSPLKHGGIYVITLILALLTLSLLFNFIRQMVRSSDLETQRKILSTEVALLETQNTQLKNVVEYAESDAYVERVARDQFGYARQDDTIIIPQFALPTPVPHTKALDSVVLPLSKPNWQRWWEALFTF